MKRIIFLLLFLATFAAGFANTAAAQEWDNGVNRQLAEYRSNSVSNVSYKLHFDIPDSLAKPVTGNAEIIFSYSGGKDLLLDFTGKLQYLKGNAAVIVNGKKTKNIIYKNEHILLPAKWLRKGVNTVTLSFESSNASLNRHKDYMYTLFVPANARSCFPCFDQPDLKARFTLTLSKPEGWESISSADSHPIPTYLFSFVCGKFQRQTVERDGRTLTALYRETDPQKVAQLGKVFDEAAHSLKWLENYTGIKYPFDSYGFVVLPGYQFGGMEHPGAIQFTDREIFLGQNPTPDEELTRLELIAHETSHMWFGDLVTMRWFNDVWTKEVFANFLANKISREVYPNVNHELNFLKSYQRPALAVDRTDGTHPIQQPLENLKDAGLLYGNIIYDKAPVMMKKLEEQASAQKFHDGLKVYLRRYSYGNATWDDLVNILDSVSPEAHLKQFSDVWVKQKGLPTIEYEIENNPNGAAKGEPNCLVVRQKDPYNRGITWQQHISMGIDYGDSLVITDINMDKAEVRIPMAHHPLHIYPNIDGNGYGRFVVNIEDVQASMELADSICLKQNLDQSIVYSILLNLHENYLMGRLSGNRYFAFLRKLLSDCSEPLTVSSVISNMGTVRYYAPDSLRHDYERQCLLSAITHPMRSARQQLFRSLLASATDSMVVARLYNMWQHQKDTTVLQKGLLTTRNYTNMAYHLAIVLPDKASNILATQRTILRTDDERREFDYVSRACTADTAVQRQLFYSLLPKSGRTVEPWARQMLSLLCDHTREPWCNSYIKPGLDNLLMIQQSSDIFFPGYWLSALLGSQRSGLARETVKSWIALHPDYPQSLMNKLKQSAYGMFCQPKE